MTKEAANSRKRASNPNRGSKPGERRGGREKGTPNRVTADIREAIRELLETSAPKMRGWLDRVAEDDPAKALDIALKAAEYAIPKLGRMEVQGRIGTSLEALVCGLGDAAPKGLEGIVAAAQPVAAIAPSVTTKADPPSPPVASATTPIIETHARSLHASETHDPDSIVVTMRRNPLEPLPRDADGGDSYTPMDGVYNPLCD